MTRAAHLATFIVLVRDRDGGAVTLDGRGQARLHYRLSAFDRGHLLRGLREAAHIHRAAGATSVLLPHSRHLRIDLGTEAELDEALMGIESWGWGPNQVTLFSAHQLGTCRMGGDAQRHPLTPAQESREVQNLFVADASVFPAASGVNPMLTIQALAHYVAQGIKSRA
jgi:choline dehydrogenase-like flavoprotein